MRQSKSSQFRGTVERKVFKTDKEFTNLKHIMDVLHFAAKTSELSVEYDVSRMFRLTGFAPLFAELAALKLKTAGWSGQGDLVTVLTDAGIHEVFATSREFFSRWLSSQGTVDVLSASDKAFFAGASGQGLGAFEFVAGHKLKATGSVAVGLPARDRAMQLRHNELQNALYEKLCKKHGGESVGTEVATGNGTKIDLVVCIGKGYAFYEIKVAPNLQSAIRQAVPQLLEYAYWRSDAVVITSLVIVAEYKISNAASAFLKTLRERFGIPIHYECFTV